MRIRNVFIAVFVMIAGLLFLAPAASYAQTEQRQVFLLDLTVTKDLIVTLNLARIVAGEPPAGEAGPSDFPGLNSAYQARIVSLDGTALYTTSIPIDFRVYDNPAVTETSETRLVLKLPYFLTARSIKLLKDGVDFGSVDLTQALCQTTPDGQCTEFCALKKIDPDCFRCGNGACEPNESAAACPTDCATALTPAPRAAPDFTPLWALAILVLAGAGLAGWQYLRR